MTERAAITGQHQHADELDDSASLHGDCAKRGCGGQNLRHGIDRQAGENAILGGVETQKLRQKRHQQHGDDAENGREGNRGGDIFRLGADGGRGSGDGRIAADGVAAGDQRRKLGRQTEHPPGGIADDQRQRDDKRNAADQQTAGTFEDGKAQGRAEKRHCNFEQGLGAEFDAG